MEKLELGDIVFVDRGLYKHYGIYIGHGRVINYAAKDGDFSGEISIHECSLRHFLNGGECCAIKFPPDYDGVLYSPKETVSRAKSRLGETKYDLVTNNCEHFAWWCKTGADRSEQVENFKKYTHVLNVVMPIILLIIYEFLFGNDNKSDNTIKCVEKITFDMLIDFFKSSRIFNKLQNNKNLVAIAVKESDEDTGNILVYGCIYDKLEDKIVAAYENDIFVLSAEKLDEKLSDLFGSKDMIILQ